MVILILYAQFAIAFREKKKIVGKCHILIFSHLGVRLFLATMGANVGKFKAKHKTKV